MIYLGGKSAIAKQIVRAILANVDSQDSFVIPFCGGCNVTCILPGDRIANDANPYLIAMWKALIYDKWEPPKEVSRELYNEIKDNKGRYESRLVGWVGFNCSYGANFFRGYAPVKNVRNVGKRTDYYQAQYYKNITKQLPLLQGVTFESKDYLDLTIPENSVIYCDPPYKNTEPYAYDRQFNHAEFWQWVRDMTDRGYKVFVSEAQAPEDFVPIWGKNTKPAMSHGKSRLEKLFAHESMGLDKAQYLNFQQASLL